MMARSRRDKDESNLHAALRRPASGKIVSTLGFSTYADILASTISTLDTPATVGIFAGWGCGKSYLMKKIQGIGYV